MHLTGGGTANLNYMKDTAAKVRLLWIRCMTGTSVAMQCKLKRYTMELCRSATDEPAAEHSLHPSRQAATAQWAGGRAGILLPCCQTVCVEGVLAAREVALVCADLVPADGAGCILSNAAGPGADDERLPGHHVALLSGPVVAVRGGCLHTAGYKSSCTGVRQ